MDFVCGALDGLCEWYLRWIVCDASDGLCVWYFRWILCGASDVHIIHNQSMAQIIKSDHNIIWCLLLMTISAEAKIIVTRSE